MIIKDWWREIYSSKWLLGALLVSLLLVSISSLMLMGVRVISWFVLPPYAVVEARVATPQVRQGDLLRIGFRIIRRRICQIDLDRFIVEVDTDTTKWRNRVPGGATPLGDEWVIIEVRLPPELPPGTYEYYTTITNNCTDGTFVTQTPSVTFSVINGDEDHTLLRKGAIDMRWCRRQYEMPPLRSAVGVPQYRPPLSGHRQVAFDSSMIEQACSD